jgi:hypothetical protein
MAHIFISHASANDAVATRICSALNDAGVEAWVDHVNGLGPQERWGEQIHHAIETCAAGLFLVCCESAGSRYCELEWTRILELDRPLYVAIVQDVPNEHIPMRLRSFRIHNLAEDFEAGLQALVRALVRSHTLRG